MTAGEPATVTPERAPDGRISLFLKGMAMGAADSVPGVSGGTIAVITNIYEPLIHALKSLNPMELRVLFREGPAAFFRAVNGGFLLTLGAGILIALLLMANTVLYLLASHREPLMGFFIGMVLASSWLLRERVGRWSPRICLLLAAGGVLTLAVSLLNPLSGSESLAWLFLCGMVAICAMILPGLSGAFVLILLGVYEYVLDALRSLHWDIILVFALGCAVGLLSFSHVLSWAFRRFREPTYAFLIGMLAASVVVLWPWREPGGPLRLPEGEVPGMLLVLLCVLVGAVLVLLSERVSGRRLST